MLSHGVFSNKAKALKLIICRHSSDRQLWSLLCICELRGGLRVSLCFMRHVATQHHHVFCENQTFKSLFCVQLSTLHDQNVCSDWLLMFIYLFKIHIRENTLTFIVKIFCAGTKKSTIQGCLLAFSLVWDKNVNRLASAWEAVILIFLMQDKRQQWFSLFCFCFPLKLLSMCSILAAVV